MFCNDLCEPMNQCLYGFYLILDQFYKWVEIFMDEVIFRL